MRGNAQFHSLVQILKVASRRRHPAVSDYGRIFGHLLIEPSLTSQLCQQSMGSGVRKVQQKVFRSHGHSKYAGVLFGPLMDDDHLQPMERAYYEVR